MRIGQRFLNFLDQRIALFGAQYKLFGIFSFVDSPIGYLLFYYGADQHNEDLMVRILRMFLCIPLIFVGKWPIRAKHYLNFYWYLTVTYCVPFLGTYMTLKNQVSTEWLMNWSLGLLWLILLVDWLMFIILLNVGAILGILLFFTLGNEFIVQQNVQPISLSAHIYIYLYATILGGLFSRNKAIIEHEREQTQAVKTVAGAIAHEMRTPLLIVQTIASGLEDHLPVLVEAYKRVQSLGGEIKKIPERILQLLNQGPRTIQETARGAFTVIDMLMVNIQENPADQDREYCSIKECVNEAVQSYPLLEEERGLISVNIHQDFHFYGVRRLMVHVFFNLIKNALYYIKAASKGNITIWTESDNTYNRLHFKDTGKGIAKDVLPRIFERFYGKTRSGTGIGLAFCSMVMQNAEGSITCRSEEGEFSEFILSFPKVSG